MNEFQKTIINTNNFLKEDVDKYDLVLDDWEISKELWILVVVIQYSLLVIGGVFYNSYFYLFSVFFAILFLVIASLIKQYKDKRKEQAKNTIIKKLGARQGRLVIDTFYNSEEEPKIYDIVNEQAKNLQRLMDKKEYSDDDLDFLKDLYY